MSGSGEGERPWPLLDEVRAFVTREGWQTDRDAVTQFEEQIAQAVRPAAPERPWVTDIPGTSSWSYETGCAPPFLRSRDAAALLEGAVLAKTGTWVWHMIEMEETGWEVLWVEQPGADHPMTLALVEDMPTEPAARTLAALEAGHHLGVWPVKT